MCRLSETARQDVLVAQNGAFLHARLAWRGSASRRATFVTVRSAVDDEVPGGFAAVGS
jgi:hypothetical protein